MKFSTIFIIVILILVVVAFFKLNLTGNFVKVSENDEFAKCLTDNGVKIYGAYWCSHCNNQKKMFGSSWESVDYIECSLPNGTGQTQICKQAGIKAYPTWEFSDGKRIEGELSLEELSRISSCSLDE